MPDDRSGDLPSQKGDGTWAGPMTRSCQTERGCSGIYPDEQAADGAVTRARQRQGFRDEPACFMVDVYPLDEDQWTDGFVSEPLPSTE